MHQTRIELEREKQLACEKELIAKKKIERIIAAQQLTMKSLTNIQQNANKQFSKIFKNVFLKKFIIYQNIQILIKLIRTTI